LTINQTTGLNECYLPAKLFLFRMVSVFYPGTPVAPAFALVKKEYADGN